MKHLLKQHHLQKKETVESKPAPKTETPKPATPRPSPTANLSINEEGFRKAHASPSVRKFARELGADLSQMTGTGEKNRILKEDVKSLG